MEDGRQADTYGTTQEIDKQPSLQKRKQIGQKDRQRQMHGLTGRQTKGKIKG